MWRMLKGMTKPMIGRRELKMLLAFSMAISLSGCAGLPKFPTNTMWEFDRKAQVCGEYRITNFENMTYAHVRDVPLNQCPAIFGFTAGDIPKVLKWARGAKKYVKDHCK